MRKEPRILIGPRDIRGRPIREMQMRVCGRNAHLTANQSSFPNLISGYSSYAAESSVAKVSSVHSRHTIDAAGIPVNVSDIYVRKVDVAAEPSSVDSTAPPRVKHFVRRQGY